MKTEQRSLRCLLTLAFAVATTELAHAASGPGYALSFDGTNDHVQAGTDLFFTVTNNFTIELWVNPTGSRTNTAEANTGISAIPGHRYAVFPDHGFESYFQMDPNGAMEHAGAGLSIGFDGISVVEHGFGYLPTLLVSSITISGWTHVALVYSNSVPRLYVNGSLVRTGLTSTKAFVHPSASLGGSFQGIGYGNYQGQLDEVRIWDRRLSETEIRANMHRILAGNESNLVVYFRCDEGTGLALTDHAPANPSANGVLTNGTSWVPRTFTDIGAVVLDYGYLTKLRFDNIGGGVNVTDLLNHPKYLNDQPDFTSLRTEFSANDTNECDNCGYVVRGLFIPTATGPHTFYLAADDGAVLFLSTDESPANKVQIAREPVWAFRRNYIGVDGDGITSTVPGRGDPPANISAPINLIAGARYYIEGAVKEATGGDNLDVAVQGPGDAPVADGDRPIFGNRIATTGDLPGVPRRA